MKYGNHMRRVCLALFIVFAAACSSDTERRVKFACDNGEDVEVHFKPPGLAVLLRNGETKELQQQPAASGFLYSKGHFSIRGKGDELHVEVGKMTPLECVAHQS
jgi:membrane-bound inhibitor of C-type lysozyme